MLYARLPLERYFDAAELEHNEAARDAASTLAKTFEELGIYVRFVAFELDTSDVPAPVATPELRMTAEIVSRALNDAERLLQTNGAVSAVDRVHTALHGYLRELCSQAEIAHADGDGPTGLWKKLKAHHPAFGVTTPQGDHIARVVGGIATILDALNPVRNNASVAHANKNLLSENDAMLVVNAARTILHYLDGNIRGA